MPNRKEKSFARKLLVAFACFVVLGTIFAFWIVGSKKGQLDKQLEAIRADGLPTSGIALNDYYKVDRNESDTTQLWIEATQLVSTRSFTEASSDLPILGGGDEVVLPGQEWPQLEASRIALKTTLARELAAARVAAKAGGQARFPVDFRAGVATLLTDTQQMRSLSRLLLLDAHVAAHDGDSDRVIGDIHDLLATSDAMAAEPCLISHLVRIALNAIAIRGMQDLYATREWTDAELADMQERLMRPDFRQGYRRALIGERALTTSALKTISLGPLRADNELLALEHYQRSIDASSLPWHESVQKSRELEREITDLNDRPIARFRYAGTLMIFPAFRQVHDATARAAARRRAAVMALAVHRQVLAGGEIPTSLTDISPEYAPAGANIKVLATDPFTGTTLILKQLPSGTGLIIYSVGKDGNDDGGRIPKRGEEHPSDAGFEMLFP